MNESNLCCRNWEIQLFSLEVSYGVGVDSGRVEGQRYGTEVGRSDTWTVNDTKSWTLIGLSIVEGQLSHVIRACNGKGHEGELEEAPRAVISLKQGPWVTRKLCKLLDKWRRHEES